MIVAFASSGAAALLGNSAARADRGQSGAPCDSHANAISPDIALQRIQAGLALRNVCVTGDLILSGEYQWPDVVLVESSIAGSVMAEGLRVRDGLNLRDSTILGALVLDDTIVDGDLTLRDTRVLGDGDWLDPALTGTKLRVGGVADWDGLEVAGVARFQDAVFLGRVTGRGAEFNGEGADFYRVTFNQTALLARTFVAGLARFESVITSSELDLSGSKFQEELRLHRLQSNSVVTIRHANVCGTLAADDIGVEILDLEDVSHVVLDEVNLPTEESCLLDVRLQWTPPEDGFKIQQLYMDFNLVELIDDDSQRGDVYRLIARTSSDEGDLSTSNRAEYKALQIETAQMSPVIRWVRTIVFEYIGGYFLRWQNPAIVLGIVLAVTFVSQFALRFALREATSQSAWAASAPGHRRPGYKPTLLASLAFTISTLRPNPVPSVGQDDAVLSRARQRGARLWYAAIVSSTIVTLLCAVLAITLANSVPVARRFLDAVA